MTKRERAQVVELLRCAADENEEFLDPWGSDCVGLANAEYFIYAMTQSCWKGAHLAFQAVRGYGDDYQGRCLEAAARVEEGRYP